MRVRVRVCGRGCGWVWVRAHVGGGGRRSLCEGGVAGVVGHLAECLCGLVPTLQPALIINLILIF